jgi:ribonuclease HI
MGSSYGSPACGAIGMVLNNWHSYFLGGYVQNIGHATSLEAEICAAMYMPLRKLGG